LRMIAPKEWSRHNANICLITAAMVEAIEAETCRA
jgi:hypothetical protein